VIATYGARDRAIRAAIGRAAISRNADPARSATRRHARTNRCARIRHPVKTSRREEISLREGTNRRERSNRLDRILAGAMKETGRETSAESAGDEVGAGADAVGATAANTLRTAAPKPPHRPPATAMAPTRRRRA
jgi:hypothetical protein